MQQKEKCKPIFPQCKLCSNMLLAHTLTHTSLVVIENELSLLKYSRYPRATTMCNCFGPFEAHCKVCQCKTFQQTKTKNLFEMINDLLRKKIYWKIKQKTEATKILNHPPGSLLKTGLIFSQSHVPNSCITLFNIFLKWVNL